MRVESLLVLLAFSIAMTQAMPAPKRFRFCGKQLASVLSLVCSADASSTGYNEPYWEMEPSVLRQLAGKQNIGVSNECCKSMCTWKTLVSYCQGSVKSRETGEAELKKLGYGEIIDEDDQVMKAPKVAAEIGIKNVKRSSPVFGTVSPEYMRLPRTLDELPSTHYGFVNYGF